MGGMIAQPADPARRRPTGMPGSRSKAAKDRSGRVQSRSRSEPAGRASMPYLIEGNNLIGRMPGISLADPDDEAQLLARMRTFCTRERTTATVYFDGAIIATMKEPAQAGGTPRFVAPPQTADMAIRRHLERLGRQAPNWTVVTSDAAVAEAARRSRARAESSG